MLPPRHSNARKVIKAMAELRYAKKENLTSDLLKSIKLARRERKIYKQLVKLSK